jgi:hypothetical protein
MSTAVLRTASFVGASLPRLSWVGSVYLATNVSLKSSPGSVVGPSSASICRLVVSMVAFSCWPRVRRPLAILMISPTPLLISTYSAMPSPLYGRWSVIRP